MKSQARVLLAAAWVIVLLLASQFSGSTSASEALPLPPGYVEGAGTHFEVTDSAYLDVTLDSSETIDLVLVSAPEAVDMLIASASAAQSTQITLGGLAPGATYYRYVDYGTEPVVFSAGVDGSYSFDLDISESHDVWIQPQLSTYVIRNDLAGGDCTAIGSWDSATKTCTLTQDVADGILIVSNYITLDGAGHLVSPPTGANARAIGIQALAGVTVRNVRIANAIRGIQIQGGGDHTVSGCSIYAEGTVEGIFAAASHSNTYAENVFSLGPGAFGIGLKQCQWNSMLNNTIGSGEFGIRLANAHGSTIAGNTIRVPSAAGFGLASSPAGGGSDNCSVYGNSFVETPVPIRFLGDAMTGNIFNLPAPEGGNYYTIFDEPAEGCSDAGGDGFCDAPFEFEGGQDNLPVAMHDSFVTGGGWVSSEAGTANFGFNARTKKNEPLPQGQTEFNLSELDLNFHSAAYDWLLVEPDGTAAQYVGTGLVNGASAPDGDLYRFSIWAVDGGTEGDDAFRIRIWYECGAYECTIFDTGAPLTLGGGSVTVHSK